MLKNQALNQALLPLTIDVIFKMFFEDPKNRDQLRHFLKATLDFSEDELSEITVLNSELLRGKADDKGLIVDLLLKSKSGNFKHLEMQQAQHSYFKERIQIYNARIAGGQINVGEDYSEVKRAISLIITGEKMFKDGGEYHETIAMRRENGENFTDVQEINIFDLSKLKNEKSRSCPKYLWLSLINTKTWEELELLAKESEEMEQAAEKLIVISQDEEARARALSRANSEYATKLHERGIREEVRKEERLRMDELMQKAEAEKDELVQKAEADKVESARKMLKDNLPIKIIERYTGLSAEEIKQLQQ